MARTPEKAKGAATLRPTIGARWDDIVCIVWCASGIQDLQASDIHQLSALHVDMLDTRFECGFLLATAQGIRVSICDDVSMRWKATLSNFTYFVQDGTMHWEDSREVLLQPAQGQVARASLPDASKLGLLVGGTRGMVKILGAYREVVESIVVQKAQCAATAALRCLSSSTGTAISRTLGLADPRRCSRR